VTQFIELAGKSTGCTDTTGRVVECIYDTGQPILFDDGSDDYEDPAYQQRPEFQKALANGLIDLEDPSTWHKAFEDGNSV
jgi:hypothetical protein